MKYRCKANCFYSKKLREYKEGQEVDLSSADASDMKEVGFLEENFERVTTPKSADSDSK